MKAIMKTNKSYIFSLIFAVLTVFSGNVWGAETIYYTMGCPKNSSNTTYAQMYDITVGDIRWKAPGNQNVSNWKLGGKLSSATDRYMYTKDAIETNVSKIVVTYGSKDSEITVNSVTLEVYSTASKAAEGGAGDISTVSGSFTASSTCTFNRPSGHDWTDRFYRLTYNMSSSASGQNKGLQLTKIEFYEVSCSSSLTTPDVTATPSSGQIQLTWPAITNATKYQVSWNGGAYADATSPYTKNSLTNGTAYTWAVKAIGSGTYCNSDPAEGSTKAGTAHAITWKVNGETYKTTCVTNGDNLVLPTNPSSCKSETEFVGWSASTISGTTTTKPTFVSTKTTITATQTYHAVFATKSSNKYALGNQDDLIPGREVLIVNPANNKALSSSATGSKLVATTISISNSTISNPSNDLKWIVYAEGARYQFKFGNNYLNTSTTNSKLYCDGDEDWWTLTTSNSRYILLSENGGQDLQYYSSAFSGYKTGTNDSYQMDFYVPEYKNYFTSCCTQLGQINGSFNVTSKSESARAFSWTKETTESDVDHYELSYKVKGAQGDPTPIANNISNSTSTYTHTANLTAGETYVYYLKAVGANNHCDATEELEVVIPQITVTGTPIAEMTYAQGDGPSSAESFVVKGKGLTDNLSVEAPANFEVCLTNSATASDWKTSGTAITITKANAESNSGQTVYVRLKAGLLNANSPFGPSNVVVSGGSATSVNVSVNGTVSSSCSVPSIGNAALTSIASGKITVSCPTISGGENCDVTDYGFIWKDGSVPTMESKDGIAQVGTNNQATAFNKELSISFTTGHTYYIKAYATNSAGTNVSATALQVTPQSVTFDINGHGSQVTTQYVNNGGTATDPETASITGYTFNGWKLNSAAYSFSTPVTGNITLVADWSIKSHTITWTTDGDALTGDYTGKSGKVNYGTTIEAPNTPTKTGYTFAAWSPTPAATMPDNDVEYTATWTAKTTAITLNKNNSDASGSNAGSASWTYNQTSKNSITAATRTGYKVNGYYTAASEGTKILNADGSLAGDNITVSTTVYTSGGKWAYNGTELTLYAQWSPITYTVAFDKNNTNASGSMSNQTEFSYGVGKTLSTCTFTFDASMHKYFAGWSKSNSATEPTYNDGQSVTDLTTTDGATVTLYAVWKDHTYTNYRTLCCTPLAAPANIAVSVTGAATATVTWDAVADATGYEYKLGDGEWTTASVTGAETKTLSLSGLTGATDYTIYVRTNGSGDNCAEGTASAGTNFRTYSTVTAAVNDALMGTAKVSLNNSDWSTSVEAADETTIYLQATPGSLYDFSNWATPSSGSISSNQLTGWTGDVTVTANFVAKELTKLATPTGMGLVGEPTATSATIKWNAVAHASGYEVVCAGATKGDITVTDGVASCPLTILTAGTTYNWTVQAIGDGASFSNSDACASQSFTTDLKKPTAIEITHEPTLTEYLEGQSFATAGMVVKVTYNNGDIDGAYTSYSITPSGALEYGTTSVTVTATLNGQSRSTTQAITVHKKYTLTFKNNGTIVETRDLKEGDAYGAFPEEGEACDGSSTTFMGWSTADISGKQETAPSEGYASPTDVMGTSNVVLYAVWAKLEGNDGADVNTIMWAENWNNATISNGSTGQSSANPDDNCSTSKGTTIYNSASISYTQSSSDYVYCRNENAAKGESSPELYIKANNSWTISGIPTGNAATLTLKFTTNAPSSLSTLTVSTTEVGKTPTMSGSITGSSAPYTGTYTITTDGASTLQIVFGHNSNVRLDDISLKVATKNISYTDYLTTCCDEWSVTASYNEGSNVINVNDVKDVTLSDVAYGAASYESDNTDVLTVASDGKITGKKAGSATVTIAWAGIPGSKCAFETTVDVTVNGPITVTYNKNDGSETPATTSQNATSNTAFTLDANSFSRTGYTFQGWATTPSGDVAYIDQKTDVSFAESTTLYAVWAINSHAVTLTQPTGNEIKATGAADLASVDFGTSITLTATENDGYVFTGWSTEDVVLANTNPVVFTMPDKDVEVTATYSTYTWDFVNYSVTPTPATEYTDADLFDKSAYTVAVNYERSDTKTPKAVNLDANDWTAKLNGTVIANNYEFALSDNEKELAFYVDETEVWSGDITVSEVAKDRFIDGLWGNTTIVKKEANYTIPTLTQRPGDAGTCDDHTTFIGWVLEANAENPTDDNKVVGGTTGQTPSNKTYYAIWAKHYSGNKDFDASKTSFATGETGSSSSVSINTDISYTTAQNGGTSGPAISSSKLRLYRKTSGDNVGGYITISATSGATISEVEFAVSTSDAVKYRVGEYSAGNMSDVTITDGKVTVSGLSVSQFTLANADGDHQLDISAITVAYSKHVEEDRDYITDCDPRYDVEFDANGATGSYDKVTKKAGVEITLPDGSALSKDHHTFAGWYSAYYDVTYSESTSMSYTVPVDGDILEAQWTEDHHAFVHFMDGESEVAGSPIKVYDGGLYNLADAPSAVSGKAFIGWSFDGSMYTAGQQNQHMDDPAEDKTYVAVWMPVIDVATAASADLSDGKWILVQNKSQLKAGDFIVIAAAGYAKALSTNQGENRSAVDVTKTVDTLSITNSVAPLFLQYDPEKDYYALYDRANTGYLYSNNNLKTQASLTMQGLWTIDIANKKASVVAQGKNNDKTMRYNTSGTFSVYLDETKQSDIAIYKWAKNINGATNVSDVANTDMVIVKNGATLTIDEPATLDNVIVEVGGKVTNTNNLTVNDLTIKSEAGKSGQVTNGNKISVNGALYMDVTFFKGATALTAETADRWYMISAPFDVNLSNGFCQVNGTPMVFGQDFDLFEYEGSKRAETGVTGWKRAQGKMNAGVACLIGFNEGQPTTIRLKAASTDLEEKTSISLQAFTGDDDNKNWNGVANPTLHYTDISHDVQTYNNEDGENGRKYIAYTASSTSFVVGTAFFLQETGTMTLSAATHGELRAPKRAEADERYEACVRIFRQEATEFGDQMYVRASETALSQYEQGHDMITWNGTTGNTAMIWAENYGKRLAIEEAPLVNDKASYELGIFAPQAGTYRIAMTSEDDAELYLTYNGRAIWNLSMSECELELAQGQNAGYGLRLVVKVPSVVTGIENSEVSDQKSDVQKVIIDEHVYILRGGQMYDVNGKMVK